MTDSESGSSSLMGFASGGLDVFVGARLCEPEACLNVGSPIERTGFQRRIWRLLWPRLRECLVSVNFPESAEVRSTRLGELAEHADRLVGVLRAIRVHTKKRSLSFLASEVWVLLEEETPPVCNIGGVNDSL